MADFGHPLCRPRTGQWRVEGSLLTTLEANKIERRRILALQDGLLAEIEAVLHVSGLDCAPRFVVVEAARQIGFAMKGLVVLAERDIEQLAWAASHVLAARPWGRQGVPLNDVRNAAWRFVLAHEVGHVRQFELGVQRDRKAWERGADVFAGKVARCLGWDGEVMQVIAGIVGCTESHCRTAYETPQGRRGDFALGYGSHHSPCCACV